MEESALKPSLRFKGFTDAWEQRKYFDIGERVNTGTLAYDNLTERGKYPAVLYGDLYTKYEFL
ncbi:MAG: hypothetical protein LUC37_00475, partial [Prevotella sp.]|nr:hypothetical protein [Prevotella sp.]